MSLIKIWIHLIFSTKSREKIINSELKPKLLAHIKQNADEKKIFIDTINCTDDHIHILISMNTDLSISKIVQLIKGESSFWINKNNFLKSKFEWQDEYMALSVSESVVPKVREYIRNQEEHHKVRTFKEEYDIFIEKFSLGGLKPE